MFNLAVVMGLSLLVVIMIINLIITAASPGSGYGVYIPASVVFIAGIVMVTLATFIEVDMIGLGFGGWGGASLFAAAVSYIVTSLVESFRQPS